MGEQGLQLGAEQQHAIRQRRIEQRLHAEPVAREKQGLLWLVPKCKGEHAAKALDARLAPGFPGVHDDFRVTAGAEHVAQRRQFRDQLAVVVDLAVENDDDRAVFVEQRLLACGQVDDRESLVA